MFFLLSLIANHERQVLIEENNNVENQEDEEVQVEEKIKARRILKRN
jgi:phage replication-related protein YjqB (UPF0714/DUF867 family)